MNDAERKGFVFKLFAAAGLFIGLIFLGYFLATGLLAFAVLAILYFLAGVCCGNIAAIRELKAQQRATTDALARMVRARRRRK